MKTRERRAVRTSHFVRVCERIRGPLGEQEQCVRYTEPSDANLPSHEFASLFSQEPDLATALRELGIQQVDFTSTDGNAQGYAFERSIAVHPVAQLPHKTTFHELAHIVLGHTACGF